MTIEPLYRSDVSNFANLPLEITISLIKTLSVFDWIKLRQVSKLFMVILDERSFWQEHARELKITYLDANLHPRIEIASYYKLSYPKSYHFAASILQNLGPTAFAAFPVFGCVRYNKLLSIWLEKAPLAPIITGSHWDDAKHCYYPYIAFSTKERWHKKVLLVIGDSEKSKEQKDYLNRLYLQEPCGPWERSEKSIRYLNPKYIVRFYS